VAVVALAGCGGGGAPDAPDVRDAITLRSPAFRDGATIPARYTCASVGKSPPLAWSGVPAGARELALTVIDPDAPGGGYVHWVLFHLPPGLHRLASGGTPDASREAVNSASQAAWAPPCPPEGDRPHHYEFTLYALEAPLALPDGASADDAVAAIGRTALVRGRLVGRFGR
jgi:Raf kinase inhibitor-like YbhB/YbcL family protein